MSDLPLEGEYFLSKAKRFRETVVFVHFWGGSKEHLKRHIRLVNEMGFDAVAFNLTFHPKWAFTRIPWSTRGEFGLKHIWADEIEWILNRVSGPKIIYSFSNPTSCAVEATIRRNTSDITGIIGDSGPFVDFKDCNSGLLEHEYHVKSKLVAAMLVGPFKWIWSHRHDEELPAHLRRLPEGFSFLSIRCGKDQLVPLSAIEHAFEGITHLNLTVLMLPDSGHLTGLRDFGSVYRPAVEEFLIGIGTEIGTQANRTSSSDRSAE